MVRIPLFSVSSSYTIKMVVNVLRCHVLYNEMVHCENNRQHLRIYSKVCFVMLSSV